MNVAVCVKQIPSAETPLAFDPTSKTLVLTGPLVLADSDSFSVEMALLRRLDADLVLAGTESSDGYTGTGPVQLAELLNYPAVSFVRHVEISGDHLVTERQTEEGFDEVTCPLPAVVSVTAGVVEVRYPSFKGIMAAKSKPVEVLTVADLGLEADSLGIAGARQEVIAFEQAELRSSGEIITDSGDAFETIVERLVSWNIISEHQ